MKTSRTLFRDSNWPERSNQWANFLVGSRGPRPLGCVVAMAIFPLKVAQKKLKIRNKHHYLYFSSPNLIDR